MEKNFLTLSECLSKYPWNAEQRALLSRTEHPWSGYQLAIFSEVVFGSGNIAVNARAGSGKTTVVKACVQLLNAGEKNVVYLAFNKDIVDKTTEELKGMAELRTTHSFGLRVIGKVTRYRHEILNKGTKYMPEIKERIDLPKGSEDYESAVGECDKLLKLCRVNLIKHNDFNAIRGIIDMYSISIYANEVEVVNNILAKCYRMGNVFNREGKEVIDYDDMITLPNFLHQYFPKYRYVFIDECQDLNTAQRELMHYACRDGGRFIAVGDPNQAINGFAGADCESFAHIASLPNTKEMPLSVNYRCGKTIISLAQKIVPQIEAFEGAIDGTITRISELKVSTFRPNDMVLCRTTAPLVSMCFKLIRNGVTALVKGRDIATNLLNLIDKSKAKSVTQFYDWAEKQKTKLLDDLVKKQGISRKEASESSAYIGFCDKVESILAVGENESNMGKVKDILNGMFTKDRRENAVMLSTAHRSKGLESDRVLILLPDKLPLYWKGQLDWEYQQERNLQYVAYTRAKKELVFVTLQQKELYECELSK